MTLTELSYIVALAQEQHFGRAAERCHVSQKDVAAANKEQLQGPLQLGTLPTIGPCLLPQFIPPLQPVQHPWISTP